MILLLSFLAASCATVQNYRSTVNTWQGASKKELFRVWGLPDKEIEMPHGRDIYIYKYKRKAKSVTDVNMVDGQAYITRTGSNYSAHYQTCTTWFTVDGGKIIDVTFQGNACEASSKFKRRYSAH